MDILLKRLPTFPEGQARQARIDHAGIISKSSFQFSLSAFFIVAVVSTILRFRSRHIHGKRLAIDDHLVMLAAVTACGATGILLYHLPMMYLMEAANRRHVSPTDDEWLTLFGLVRWTQALIPSIWLSIFSTKFSLLVSFYRMSSQQPRNSRLFFWGVVVFTIFCWGFQSTYMAFACPRVDEEALECLTTYPMNEHDEPHNMFIVSWSSRLDVCSDILLLTIASVFYNSSEVRSMPKRTMAGLVVLYLAKMIMGVLRVSVTNGYMGYGYTWSLYWQALEAYALIVLESFLVIRSVFVPIEKLEASEYLALSRVEAGVDTLLLE